MTNRRRSQRAQTIHSTVLTCYLKRPGASSSRARPSLQPHLPQPADVCTVPGAVEAETSANHRRVHGVSHVSPAASSLPPALQHPKGHTEGQRLSHLQPLRQEHVGAHAILQVHSTQSLHSPSSPGSLSRSILRDSSPLTLDFPSAAHLDPHSPGFNPAHLPQRCPIPATQHWLPLHQLQGPIVLLICLLGEDTHPPCYLNSPPGQTHQMRIKL